MRIILPAAPLQTFAWNSDAVPPSIPLSTDVQGPHKWSWSLSWNTFAANGSALSPTNSWNASVAAAAGGGALTVTAQAGTQSATAKLKITGINPTVAQVTQFVVTQPNGSIFNKILQHESGVRNFGANGEPIVSFDHGYGLCQLTNPKPTFVQAWNWKSNVQGGLALFAGKRNIAIKYLSQGNRAYTDSQLQYETVSLWNGGHYHIWNGKAWVRNQAILCDPKTGNIGWNTDIAANSGKTVAQLHQRDSASYGAAPTANSDWGYFGVCYADKILS